MRNYINYLQHQLQVPAETWFNLSNVFAYKEKKPVKNDDKTALKKDEQEETSSDKAKRIAISFLPLVSLYQPIGQTLSIGLTSVRLISNSSEMLVVDKKDNRAFYSSMFQVALSTAALAGTVFHYKFCLLFTNFADVGQSCVDLGKSIKEKDKEKIIQELLHLAAATSFTATLLSGSLETVFASYLVQVVLNAYLAGIDIKEGRLIEASGKLAMGTVRGYQAQQVYLSIQRRNLLLKGDLFKKLFENIKKSRETYQLLSHRLAGNLEGTIQEDEVILEDINGTKYNTGSHYHGYGKGLVKGMNVDVQIKNIKGKEIIELDFKMSHVHRERLETLITQMKEASEPQLKEFLSLTNSQAKSVYIDNAGEDFDPDMFWFGADRLKSEHLIEIVGLGSLAVGSNQSHIGSYNHLFVRMEADKTLFDMYELLALFDLEDALLSSAEDDIERLKLGHLYHTLFPKEAYSLERDPFYFEASLEELKMEMIRRAPEAEKAFALYLDKMQLQDILPGRQRYAIQGLGKDVRALGGRTLVSTLMATDNESKESLLQRVGSILKMGMFSLESRQKMGMAEKGLNGSFSDFVGGSDSVFTQMISDSVCEEKMPIDELEYIWFADEPILVLIDLEQAVETGTYQYHDDNFGIRQGGTDSFWWWDEPPYPNREGILEFAKNENENFSWSNEVMVKERILPQMIKGLVVQNEYLKQEIINYLIKKDMIHDGKILQMEVDQFIRVADHFSEELVP